MHISRLPPLTLVLASPGIASTFERLPTFGCATFHDIEIGYDSAIKWTQL
jgi:hypothetical protein